MLDLPHLSFGGQQVVEVPAPSGRVLARAIAAHLGPVEHSFHAPAHPRGCLGLPGPDRFEHLEHEPGIDCRHRQLADHRAHVGGERVLPLLAMLRVSPPRFVGVDVCSCTVGERHRLCGLDGSRRPLLVACGDGVEARGKYVAAPPRPLPPPRTAPGRLTDAHIPPPRSRPTAAKYPPLRATGRDAKNEPAAIAVVAALPDALHPYRREPSEYARYVSAAHHHAHHEGTDASIHRPPNVD